jgi:hypothetical protein
MLSADHSRGVSGGRERVTRGLKSPDAVTSHAGGVDLAVN